MATLHPSLTVVDLALPALLSRDLPTAKRIYEFFTVNIRNPHTRRAYSKAVRRFGEWCAGFGIGQLRDVQPVHVAAYIESLGEDLSAPTVKQHLAALRMLFDWLVVGQLLPVNPAHAVRGPRHSVKTGKTPVLSVQEIRELFGAIDTRKLPGMRDRALMALLVYTFARVGAAVKLRVEDVYSQGSRLWVRLQEKGGKRHEMPCHHRLEEYLHEYLQAAALTDHPKRWLFQTVAGASPTFSGRPMSQADVYRMVRRRAAAAGIQTRIGCHSFRATGITEYLRNGGKLEVAQQMANHESARTTGLYDRRNDQVSLDEVERILL